jgi:hypothetical protein
LPTFPLMCNAGINVDSSGRVLNFLGAENDIFAPFIYKNEHFTKTGSGQT